MRKGEKRPPGVGRQKGTPNKKSVELAELMANKYPHYDPVVSMAEIANDPSVDLQHRITCHKEVAKYVRPQLRSMTIQGSIGVVDLTIGKMPE